MNRIVEYYSKDRRYKSADDANRSGITKCFGYKDVACVIDANISV
jgi:hypothetical protein